MSRIFSCFYTTTLGNHNKRCAQKYTDGSMLPLTPSVHSTGHVTLRADDVIDVAAATNGYAEHSTAC